MRVLVLGAGLMGAQIGYEYVAGGHDVTFIARDPDAAAARVARASALAEQVGLEPKGSYEISARVERAPDLVVESLPEDLELKAELLAPLAGDAGDRHQHLVALRHRARRADRRARADARR